MYWSEVILTEIGTREKRIGIMVGNTRDPVKPIFVILSEIKTKGRKRKWEKPKRIRDWILYKNWQKSFLTTFPRLFGYVVQFVSKENLLYHFDRELIKKKFPTSRQFLI